MKKLIGFFLIISILFTAGCTAALKPESTVSAFIEAGQKFDTIQMATLVNPSNPSIKDNISEAMGNENDNRNQYQKYFLTYFKENAAKMTYTIKESQTENDQAVVTIDFQYIDGGPLLTATLQDVFSKAYSSALNGTPMKTEDIGQLLVSTMQKYQETNEESFMNRSLDVKLIKVDKTWYISELNEDFLDVFLSNYITVSKEFEKAMNPSANSTENIIQKTVGDEIILKTIKLKVNYVEEIPTITSTNNTSQNASDGMKFIVINADVTNTTSEAFTFPPNLVVVDNDGREYNSYLNTPNVIDDYLDYRQLPPGIKQTGSWIYELPTDSASYSLYVRKSGTNDLYAILLK